MGVKIDRIVLRLIRMPLVRGFETSFGRTTERAVILVEAAAGGVSGWGEATAPEAPFFNEEWTESAWALLRDFIAPAVAGRNPVSASGLPGRLPPIRGHNMTKAGLETALWDLEARLADRPLYKQIKGGPRKEIPCGVSIGIQPSLDELLRLIDRELEAGYQRIKLKIKPGWDVDVIGQVRRRHPNVKLMADANSAYTLADTEHLKRLDDFYLMMIEQPLAHDDILDHAKLQKKLATPICLDESIRSARHAGQAIATGAGGVINPKRGRGGGFGEAKRVHDVAREANVPVWCGGMLESGVGRAHNIALSTLPNFVLPGDVSASERYWKRDIIQPAVTVTNRGTIEVRDNPGLGYGVDTDYIDTLTVRREVIT